MPGKELSEETRALCSRVDQRIDAIASVRENRVCILKSFVLNQYEMMTLGAGFIFSATETRILIGREFQEVLPTDPRAGRAQVERLRRGLIEAFPFWLPNLLRLGVQFEDQAALEAGVGFLEGMVIDSDLYAQLLIDARHNPLSKIEPWMRTNTMPWHLAQRFLEVARRHGLCDAPEQIVARLRLE